MAIETHLPRPIRDGSYPPETIPSLAELLDELNGRGIPHCQWKSNEHLIPALAGLTDLDLLVDGGQAASFREVAAARRLKLLVPPTGSAYPGMEHYLGFDRSSGRLFHLHVHYQLVLGERYVKNYRIPMERQFLSSAHLMEGVWVPSPELELSVLSVRALLKYRIRDLVKDVLDIRSPGLPAEIRSEMDWLLHQTTPQQVRATIREACHGAIPADLVGRFLDIAAQPTRPGPKVFLLRERLRAALTPYQRHNRTQAGAEYLADLVRAWSRERRHRPSPRMTTSKGGTMVALVGADGSGKSTVSESLEQWLSWKLEVRRCYLGSKAPSRLSSGLYLGFRALRRSTRTAEGWSVGGPVIARPLASGRDAMLALHHLSIGRDRSRRYRRALRDAHTGRIVIFDRFPMESLSTERDHRLLDGPQIGALLDGSMGPVTRALARAEERMYRRFRLPDHLVLLEVSPEVSIGRKPDHKPEVIAAKSRATLELATLAETAGEIPHVIRVDADRPLDQVLLDIKRELWDVL